MAIIPPEILEWRKRTGADQYDEMWEGVLHMVAAPNREHQDLEGALEAYLRWNWARTSGGRVYHQINVAMVGGWPTQYRIPDLVLLTPERFVIDKNEYFEGAPEVVVEIRSKGDETYDKLAFYADLGVPEVWVIERDSKRVELFRLDGTGYVALDPDSDGWHSSRSVPIQLRQASEGKLSVRLHNQEKSRLEIPE